MRRLIPHCLLQLFTRTAYLLTDLPLLYRPCYQRVFHFHLKPWYHLAKAVPTLQQSTRPVSHNTCTVLGYKTLILVERGNRLTVSVDCHLRCSRLCHPLIHHLNRCLLRA